MRAGEYEVRIVSEGSFRLDGGAMFGVVPKILWSKLTKPDRKNRIHLGLSLLFLEGKGQRILVDTGFGSDWTEKEKRIYEMDGVGRLKERLEEIEVGVEDVDFVVNTHLHFDHAGGNCVNGEPLFRNAKYLIQKDELDVALNPNPHTASSYRNMDLQPLLDRGLVLPVDGEYEVAPGVRLIRTDGHTKGHQAVLIRSGGVTVFFPADLIPTRFHLNVPYIMGYDLYPGKTAEMKAKFLKQAAKEGWLLVFEHNVDANFWRVEEVGGKYKVCKEDGV